MDKKEKELRAKLVSALIDFAEDYRRLSIGRRIAFAKKIKNEINRNSDTAN